MRLQQRLFVLAFVGCAALAACSGSFGSGSGLPNTLASLGPGAATPAPSPSSMSAVLTVGDSTSFQTLPEIGGYGGAIAFPKVTPEPVKSPSGKGAASPAPAPTPVSIAIGATLSVTKPSDGPDLNLESGKGKHRKTRERPARPLAFITLLATHDVILDSYPRIALDVPRDIATQYRDGEFGLALWNSGEKDAAYRLAVAELDRSTTPPPAPQRAAAALPAATSGATTSSVATTSGLATPSAAPTLMSRAGSIPGMGGNVPVAGSSMAPLPGAAAASAAPTLPPQRILFAGTATTLKLIANRPAVFAVYALPHPSSANATSAPATSSSARAAASPVASSSPRAPASPVASSSPPATITSAPSAAPSASPAPANSP